MVSLVRTKTVTARKAHTCACCGVVAIHPGQTYVRETYTHDGRIYDWVSCAPCQEIAGDVYEWAGAPDDGVGNDQYVEWAEEMVVHGSDEVKARALAFLARAGIEAVA